MRGIQLIHAVRIVAELGDLARFGKPRALMGYLGLVPSEDSSGGKRAQGAITKAGNSSARRAMVEAAWAYQHRRHDAHHRPPTGRGAQGRARHRLEGPVAIVCTLSQARRPRRQPQQDRGRHGARTRRLRVGHRAAGQTGLMASITRNEQTRKETTHPQIPNSSIGEVVRSRLENPRQTLLDRIAATPQSLERGSSMTNNSLAANQRPHISLIDRRHR